ncbi:MAG: thioredoxin family protein [Myxococcaceae bacterium]
MATLLLAVLAANPPELGKVTWLRDFEQATARARETGKPLLVLFDEVPGCSTVLGFGEGALSDPAVVERVQRDFVPVAVFNNVGGADAKVLASFGEPTWNNPVVRVIDADRQPLAPRFEGPYTKAAFLAVLDQVAAPKLERATLAAGCFWECEAALGDLDAVKSSRVGFLGGDEVVELQFDPHVMSRAKLLETANARSCALKVYVRTDDEERVSKAVRGIPVVRTSEALRYSEKDTKYFLKHARGASAAGLSETEAARQNASCRLK